MNATRERGRVTAAPTVRPSLLELPNIIQLFECCAKYYPTLRQTLFLTCGRPNIIFANGISYICHNNGINNVDGEEGFGDWITSIIQFHAKFKFKSTYSRSRCECFPNWDIIQNLQGKAHPDYGRALLLLHRWCYCVTSEARAPPKCLPRKMLLGRVGRYSSMSQLEWMFCSSYRCRAVHAGDPSNPSTHRLRPDWKG